MTILACALLALLVVVALVAEFWLTVNAITRLVDDEARRGR